MTNQTPFDADFQAELGRLFRLRRDVRRFRGDPVPEALVDEILGEVGFAPSVGLSEPWRYVRVDEGAARSEIRDTFERCNAEALKGYQGDDARIYASLKLAGLIPSLIDQNLCAHFRSPMDMIFQGCSCRLRHA
jgi:5,6-dimethylbenzimidazole synthase